MSAANARNARNAKNARSKQSKQLDKHEKTRRNLEEKSNNYKIGALGVLAVCVILGLIFVPLFGNVDKIMGRNERIAALEREFNHKRIQNDAAEQKLNAPIDDEYAERIAREEGYKRSDEIIFYFN